MALQGERSELGRQFEARMDALALSVTDKINSFQNTVNQRLEEQALRLRSLGPTLADEDHEFKVVSFRTLVIGWADPGTVSHKVSRGEATVSQRRASHIVQTRHPNDSGCIGFPEGDPPRPHGRSPSHRPHIWIKFRLELASLSSIRPRLLCDAVPGG